jgi:FkbM family methyltransferase
MRAQIVEKIINLLEFFFQLQVSRYLSRSINPSTSGDYIFDVGANRGSISKIYLRLFPGTRIIAIEPLPIFSLESELIELIEVALSDKEGIGEFFICGHTPSSSLILPNPKSNWYQFKSKILGLRSEELYRKIQIEITTLDKVISARSIKSVLLLKIDTEGSEFNILRGGSESLRSGVIRNIQLESQSNAFRENHQKEIFEFLEECGFVHKKSMKHFFGNFKEEFFSLARID